MGCAEAVKIAVARRCGGRELQKSKHGLRQPNLQMGPDWSGLYVMLGKACVQALTPGLL
jgi:hypothetical protein